MVEDGNVVGAVVQNKNGQSIVRAKRVVDCTGDGDVAFHAGCRCEVGRASDNKCQPVTLMFTIGGVEWDKVKAWRTSYQMRDTWEEAQQKGDMRPFQKTIMGWWWTPTRPDQVGVNFTHVIYVDATDAAALTRATVEPASKLMKQLTYTGNMFPHGTMLHGIYAQQYRHGSRAVQGDYVLTGTM